MKISIIGAGNVGALSAMRIAAEQLGDIVLVDIAKGLALGKALDMADAAAIARAHPLIEGTEDFSRIAHSDIIVVTAGLARKPGMTREDLLAKNNEIMKGVCKHIRDLAPQAIVIAVTNPLDAMTYCALKALGFDKSRVFGMGGSLDAGRFCNLIASQLKIPNQDIQATVIGSHGELMLPLPRFTYVKGKSLVDVASFDTVRALVEATKKRGQAIVALLGTGSAYFAPSLAVAQLVMAIAKDQKKELAVSAYLDGEYGVQGICVGVPCIIGANGIEKIITIDLNQDEKEAFLESTDSIRELTRLIV